MSQVSVRIGSGPLCREWLMLTTSRYQGRRLALCVGSTLARATHMVLHMKNNDHVRKHCLLSSDNQNTVSLSDKWNYHREEKTLRGPAFCSRAFLYSDFPHGNILFCPNVMVWRFLEFFLSDVLKCMLLHLQVASDVTHFHLSNNAWPWTKERMFFLLLCLD